ncbi:hypothetical protein FACS1894184_20800 [Clostridia bacterium]|nr:hypothetical protein FACS1894184_20800 [Clostridia bacterium]
MDICVRGISMYNMIVMRNFLQAVPRNLEESAMVDGARHLRILTWIYIPLAINGLISEREAASGQDIDR